MTIVPRANRLHERVAALLAREIVSGRLPTEGPIPSEPELIDEYGVSKTVARETVQALSAANLVTIQHGKRTVVRREGEWNHLSRLVWEALRAEGRSEPLISELYDVRLLLEPMVARKAAESARPAQIDEIVAALNSMEGAIPIATRDFLEFDRQFHVTVSSAASSNRILEALMRDVHELLGTSWKWSKLSDEEVAVVFDQHRQIAGAIAAGDANEAEAAMRKHIQWAAATDRRMGSTSRVDG
jgi:DNA-binding FadR family transcriptional regulator